MRLSPAAVRTRAHIIACHVKNQIISPAHAANHSFKQLVSVRPELAYMTCFGIVLVAVSGAEVRKHSGRRACAYHYPTKHSLQEYLPYPLYQHDMSPHALRLILNTQAQHLFGTGLHSNHDSLEWNASNITDAKLWSEQKCMYVWGLAPWSPPASPLLIKTNRQSFATIYHEWIYIYFYFIYCRHQSHKNEVCRREHYSHDCSSSWCRLCATCSQHWLEHKHQIPVVI